MPDEKLIPYRGLNPYRERHARFFFGRDAERENVISYLMGSRLTLLYGPTGVGKSSILRAGVAHHLNLIANENLEKHGTPEFAVVVFNKWVGEPLLGLEKSIRESVAQTLKLPEVMGGESSTNLSLALQTCSDLVNGDILIILDQFEEYFLYHGRNGDDGGFAKEFARAVNRPNLRVGFLISIRDDALAKLDHFKGKIPDLFRNYLRIEHLSNDAAREAITEPLEVYSKLTGADPAYKIEPALVEEVCRQVEAGSLRLRETVFGAGGAKPDRAKVETSVLQLVMRRLWEEELSNPTHCLRLSTLEKLGGAVHIVQTHLEKQMQALPDEAQGIAAKAFHYLVTPSGNKIAYTASDLASLTELPREKIDPVLEKLGSQKIRILRPFTTSSYDKSETNYEIFHDVLAPAILDWRSQYIRQKETRRETRRSRQLAGLLLASVLVTALMFFLYLYAERQRARAIKAQEEIKQAQKNAELKEAEAQSLLNIIHALDEAPLFFKAIMRGHSKAVVNVNFSPDNSKIITASLDNTARLWNALTGESVAELKAHQGGVNNALFSPDGTLLVTASKDSTARTWDVTTAKPLHTLADHTGEVNDARFSHDGKYIVTASEDGTARTWDSVTGQSVAVMKGHAAAVNYAAFSPDDQLVVTASADGTARVWKTQTGELQVILADHQGEVNMASFSPDGKLIVTASSDFTAIVWDARDGKVLSVLKGHSGPVNTATFSHNGKLVATASDDRTAKIWDAKSWQLVKDLRGHSAEVVSAVFSNDDTRIITASADNKARVWEAAAGTAQAGAGKVKAATGNVKAGSGNVLFELSGGHISKVRSAVFSPDGKLAATAGEDNTARTWDISGKGGIRVMNVSVTAVPASYSGTCPARVKFIARISVVGSGTIKYRFVRKNVEPGPERSLVFESEEVKEDTTTWIFGGKSNPNPSGSFYIEVTSPQSYTSGEATYSIRCQFAAPSREPETPAPSPQPATTPSP